jgi:AcrR family transcriptional regulator
MTTKRAPTRRTRAERQAETRRRIVEAAVDLHTTVGPARTTISGIAERAGVQRHTVYAHFPDPHGLFRACRGLWLERNPYPDVGAWAAIDDPRERLRVALDEVYRYWERTGDELSSVMEGAQRVPEMAESLRQTRERTAAAARLLAEGWGARGRRRVRLLAVIEHALALDTWRSVVERGGLRREEAVRLMTAMAEGA